MSRSDVVKGKVRTLPFTTYIFINLAYQFFQFPDTFLCRRQPFPLSDDVAGLLLGLGFLNRLDKLCPVISEIPRTRPEHIGNQCQDSTLVDSVLCGAEDANRDLAVPGAGIL